MAEIGFWPRLFSIQSLGWYLDVSPKTLRNKLADKEKPFPLKPLRVNGLVRFKKEDIDRWIDEGLPGW